jgi:hypothetical protein
MAARCATSRFMRSCDLLQAWLTERRSWHGAQATSALLLNAQGGGLEHRPPLPVRAHGPESTWRRCSRSWPRRTAAPSRTPSSPGEHSTLRKRSEQDGSTPSFQRTASGGGRCAGSHCQQPWAGAERGQEVDRFRHPIGVRRRCRPRALALHRTLSDERSPQSGERRVGDRRGAACAYLWSYERVGQGVNSSEIMCEIGAEVVTLGEGPWRVVGDRRLARVRPDQDLEW